MARAVEVGDVVEIIRHLPDYATLYGVPALKPFTVEAIQRLPRCAVVGGGMLVWRSLVKRVPREPRK